MNFDEIKTKKFQNVLNNLNVNKALVVLEDGNTNAEILLETLLALRQHAQIRSTYMTS